ncbi:geranylgeranyl pyrophosphate synthase/polyprenyl synthetase-like protein, partial [Leptotrombidium deliense]
MSTISKFVFFSKNFLPKVSTNSVLHRKHSFACPANTAFKEAERLTSVPLSHFQIKNMMRDEYDLSQFALDKVIDLKRCLHENNHPIISVAQQIFEECDSEHQKVYSSGGLVVLLVAKVLQSVPSFKESSQIWDKQKVLAECYEMIDKAMFIHHKSIINIPPNNDNDKHLDILNSGNKLAVLGGDYLFSYGIIRLASLVKRASVFDFIGAAIDDYCITHFKCDHEDKHGNMFPWEGISVTDWEQLGGYCSTNLLAYSCQYVAILSNLSSIRFEKAAYDLGRNLRLKWNIEEDIKSITDEEREDFKLFSAPVVLHIQRHPKFLRELHNLSKDDKMNIKKIKEIILEGNAVKDCEVLLNDYSSSALRATNLFPDNEERQSLRNIIFA